MTNQIKKKKRSSLSHQTVGVIILGIVCLLMVGALIAVHLITSVTPVTIDGNTYYVRRETKDDGSAFYKLTDKNKNVLQMTEDGYYVGLSGTLIRFDPATGETSKYAAIDTEGNEQVGHNDRILIFPYTTRQEIQSIQVFNNKGNYAFYRLRKYEDTDKTVYTCYLNNGKYYLISENGTEYTPDKNGLYSLPSGTKLSVDPTTGIMRTHSITDFDGKVYTVEKRAGDEGYRIYSGSTPLDPTLTKTGEKLDSDGKPYTDTLYSYAVTDYGSLVSVDPVTGILTMQSVREYEAKTEKFFTYHFLYRNGKYVMCDGEGKLVTDVSIDDKDYYRTSTGTYLAFNPDNGSYSVRIRKDYYIKSDNNGVFSLYVKGSIASTNSLGYCPLPDGSYLYFDSESGSYSILQFTGETYTTVDSRYLNAGIYADADGDFVISGYEESDFDPSLFAGLVVTTGYTITAAGGKLTSPARLPSGEIDFMQYGLEEGTRIDASGREYHHTPPYFILTDLKGNVHKVTIGDAIVSNGGYYVKYEGYDGEKFVERQAVYILLDNESTGYTNDYKPFTYRKLSDTVLAPVEKLITPMAVYPMQQNSYFDVSHFTIMTYNPERALENLLNDDPDDDNDYYDISIRFSYHDLDERTNTIHSSFPYVMETCELYGYAIDTNKVDDCLLALKDLSFVGVSSLAATDADMVRFGLSIPQYIIYYESDLGGFGTNTEQVLSVSALSPNGTYYVYSSYYDMIVEVDKNKLQFLSWKGSEWLSDDVYFHTIGFCEDLKLETDDYWAHFDFDTIRVLETTINTSGSSTYTQIVRASNDRKKHTLSLAANLGANSTSGAKALAEIISVDFNTLKNYYTYVQSGKRPQMTEAEGKLLDQFMENAIQKDQNGKFVGTSEQNGVHMTSNTLTFTTSSLAFQIQLIFSFTPSGDITAAAQVNNESPTLLFSMSAYENYEKLMFDEKLTESERREALDFYTASGRSATATTEYDKVTATNSEGLKSVYTNEKIVTTHADGTKTTDYCMTNDIKVFFSIEGSEDLIGVGTRWIRRYLIKNNQSTDEEYREIKDETYTFTATASQVVTVGADGKTTTIPGGLSRGRYTVTIDENMATVKDESGKLVARYLRYAGTSVLSAVYDGWLWATYEGLCEIPEEQKEAFRNSDDSACQVKITVNTKTGDHLVYRTYPYSERRSYVTVNGEGDFFMLRSFVDKVIDASKIVFDNIYVDPDSKYND